MRLQLLLVVGGWLGGWWLLFAVPVLAAPGGRRSPDTSETDAHDGARPRLSVIIPARDEAASLPHLLASLVPQLAPGDELIVVDDRSTDATAALAREAGALVIEAPELPDGWTGKSWACHHGAATATGEVLVFFDADVRLAPGALSAAVDLHRRQGGLVSVQPYHETERAYERLSALFNVVAFMGVGAASPHRAGRAVGAFGPCLVISADDYRRVGGHEAVRDEVVEDLALARAVRAAGLGVVVRAGGELIHFRMYPGGFRQLVEGWTKNFATGAGTVPVVRTLLVAWWITGMLVTIQWLIETAAGAGPGWPVVVLGYAAVVGQLWHFFARLGDFGLRWALAYPVLLATFVGVFVRSLYRTLIRRSVTWRGRTVPVRPRVAAGREPA